MLVILLALHVSLREGCKRLNRGLVQLDGKRKTTVSKFVVVTMTIQKVKVSAAALSC